MRKKRRLDILACATAGNTIGPPLDVNRFDPLRGSGAATGMLMGALCCSAILWRVAAWLALDSSPGGQRRVRCTATCLALAIYFVFAMR